MCQSDCALHSHPCLLPLGQASKKEPGGKGCRQKASKQERAITEMESMPEGGERGWKKGTGRNLRGRL